MSLSSSKIMNIALSSEDYIVKKEQLNADITSPFFRAGILRFSAAILRFKTYLTDNEILLIASEPDSTPIWPFDLKDEVTIKELKDQVLRFAKRIQKEKLATGEIN